MQIRLSEGLAAAAGVLIFDYVFCGLIAPKVLSFIGLQAAKARPCCEACEAGYECKNITDRTQVIDITPDTAFRPYRLLN